MKKYIKPNIDMLEVDTNSMIMRSDSIDMYPEVGDTDRQGAYRRKEIIIIEDEDDW